MSLHIGNHFVSPEGADALKTLRIGSAPTETTNPAPIRLLARVPSEECGCPEADKT